MIEIKNEEGRQIDLFTDDESVDCFAMTKTRADWRNFLLGMWLDNCDERKAYGEERLSYEEYVEKNKDFFRSKI